jgi:hypothetical protein
MIHSAKWRVCPMCCQKVIQHKDSVEHRVPYTTPAGTRMLTKTIVHKRCNTAFRRALSTHEIVVDPVFGLASWTKRGR